MFQQAQNTLVTGGTFNAVHNTFTGSGLDALQKRIASGAFHNSSERYDPPKCHPRTRVAVLDKILTWVTNQAKTCSIIWLYGPAGAGKSAIAQTIAELCHNEGLLAASFFFSRNTPTRNDEVLLVTTLVYQLTISIPEIRKRIENILQKDPLILSRSLEAQLDTLIVQPLNEMAEHEESYRNLLSRPRFVVIDGLDECGEGKAQAYILNVLQKALQILSIPMFILIASRPNPAIRDAFNLEPLSSMTMRIVLDDTYKPDADIKLFVESRFQDIRRKHPQLARANPPWPSPLDMQLLVQKSSGQFIYASTVMKYLDSHHHWPPDRLDIAFGLTSPDDDSPLAELDLFYYHILSSVKIIDKVMDIFIFLLMVQFWDKTRRTIEQFFFYRPGEVDVILSDLHSLISIPPPHDSPGELRIFHASFPDFLLDRSRSKKFFIDKTEASTKLVGYCLRHFQRGDAMCQDEIHHHHLRALFMIHCVQAKPTQELMSELTRFDMYTQLSFWDSDENVIGAYEHDYKRILCLLSWLTTQNRTNPAIGLFQTHMHAFDDWLRDTLESYPHPFQLQQLLVAGTYTKFQIYSEEIVAIMMTSAKASRRRHDPLQIYAPKPEFSPFYEELCRFLLDPSRSGPYHVDGEKYSTFCSFLAVFLLHNGTTYWDNRLDLQFAHNVLEFAIPKSAPSNILTKALKSVLLELVMKLPHLCSVAMVNYINAALPSPKHELCLAVAYNSFKEEVDLPTDAYTIWISQVHDCADHVEHGYDFCIP
ncbi:hypothetical protein D9613_010461 [Agrocybe pediades]|uniref:NACHT domain-containing protein n=1 Tax=Agrocybe pediades TaxID=84607 RepID=A0A8H4QFX9_9AGAR|nr:hypothetical protein D9613_010461 [Agrocybe pediades]